MVLSQYNLLLLLSISLELDRVLFHPCRHRFLKIYPKINVFIFELFFVRFFDNCHLFEKFCAVEILTSPDQANECFGKFVLFFKFLTHLQMGRLPNLGVQLSTRFSRVQFAPFLDSEIKE